MILPISRRETRHVVYYCKQRKVIHLTCFFHPRPIHPTNTPHSIPRPKEIHHAVAVLKRRHEPQRDAHRARHHAVHHRQRRLVNTSRGKTLVVPDLAPRSSPPADPAPRTPRRGYNATLLATTLHAPSPHARECEPRPPPSPPPRRTHTLLRESLPLTPPPSTYSHSPSRWAPALCRRLTRDSRKSPARAARCSAEAISAFRTYSHIYPQSQQVMGHRHRVLVDRRGTAHPRKRLEPKLQGRNTQEIGRAVLETARGGGGNSGAEGARRAPTGGLRDCVTVWSTLPPP